MFEHRTLMLLLAFNNVALTWLTFIGIAMLCSIANMYSIALCWIVN